MNNTTDPLPRIQEIIAKGTQGAIVLPTTISADALAAGTALYLALSKMGKSVSLVCQSPSPFEMSASDKIQSQLVTTGDNLVVSFPYKEGAIDKVDYNIQGDKFNLIIAPRAGMPKLNPSQVSYTYTGGMLNFIITIDAPTLNALGTVYTDNQAQFQGRDIINIDRHLTNSFYGSANFVNKTASSVSELVLSLLTSLQAEMDRDIATNLYMGISAATNNFSSYSVNATTFETVAQLLRMGGTRKTVRKPVANNVQPMTSPMPQSLPTNEFNLNAKPIEEVEKQANPEGPPAPQDWLKPKIFRGGGVM